MTLKEQIGQRFVAGVEGLELTAADIEFLREYKIGNVILFERNVDNKEQLQRLCSQIHSVILDNTGIPAFICMDQEGGRIHRLNENFVNIEGAGQLASYGSSERIFEAGVITGQELASVGVDVNLAPVLDVNSNPANPIIGDRSYSSDPVVAGKYAMEMAKGLMSAGIMPCGKHFPGHGDTSTDSHLTLPLVNKSRKELDACELIPFKYAIEQGIPAIMTTHILFPQLDGGEYPATMSPHIIPELLRREFRFNGLVFSDCLEMKAIADFFGTDKGALMALQAEVDCVIISHTQSVAAKAFRLIEQSASAGLITSENMDHSLARILNAKKQWCQR